MNGRIIGTDWLDSTWYSMWYGFWSGTFIGMVHGKDSGRIFLRSVVQSSVQKSVPARISEIDEKTKNYDFELVRIFESSLVLCIKCRVWIEPGSDSVPCTGPTYLGQKNPWLSFPNYFDTEFVIWIFCRAGYHKIWKKSSFLIYL